MTTVETTSAEHAEEGPPPSGTVQVPDESPPAGPVARVRPVPGWLSVVSALACGGVLLLAFPPFGLWWLAPVGVALLAVAVDGRRVRAGLGLGALCGAVFFVPL